MTESVRQSSRKLFSQEDWTVHLTTGPTAPAPCYTPLALILLFWETSAAALACRSKAMLELNTTEVHQSLL